MLEAIERHNQALAYARMFQRPFSITRIANNGQYELVQTYHYKETV